MKFRRLSPFINMRAFRIEYAENDNEQNESQLSRPALQDEEEKGKRRCERHLIHILW